jgi:thiamine monophosphate synthase
MIFLKKFLFLDDINKVISENICRIKNISIIILINPSEKNNQTKKNRFYEIIHFCKSNNLPFFVSDNCKLAIKTKAKGVYLTSSNRKIIYKNLKKNITIIGTAHNQIEYYFKKKQNCSLIFLSPFFLTNKFTINKVLGPLKFNLITNTWKTDLGCLGGVTTDNYKKIKLTKANSVGFKSLIYKEEIKKPVYFKSRRVLN